MLAAGSGILYLTLAYAFSLYGPQLAAKLSLSQSEIAFVASCANMGIYIGGPIAGFLVDRNPGKVWLFLLFGALLIGSGYSLAALTYSNKIPNFGFLITALYYLMVGFGSASVYYYLCQCYHCALATNYRNWPIQYQSAAVGMSV
jgi:MFS family permease